jgi:hypothetical protein
MYTKMFFNTLWKHLKKFETNLMNIEYQKHFFSSVTSVFNT